MTSTQDRIREELNYLCRELHDGDHEKMLYDIIAVLAYWSESVAYDKEWQNGY